MKKLTFLSLLAIILLSLIVNEARADRVARGLFGGALGGAAIGGLAGGGRGAAIGAGIGAGIGSAAGAAAQERAQQRYEYIDHYGRPVKVRSVKQAKPVSNQSHVIH